MKTRSIKSILVLLLFALPTLTFAGEIFGTLKKDGKPVANQEIKITQNGNVLGKATTDANGYYSITIRPVGKVNIEVTGYDGAVLEAFSTNTASDYNLVLSKAGDKWQLKKT